MTAIFLLNETFEVVETKSEIHNLINESSDLDILVNKYDIQGETKTSEIYIMKAHIQYYK